MKVHIFTKQEGKGFVASIDSELQKDEFLESLPTRLALLDFDSAIIIFNNGGTHKLTNLQNLIKKLNKIRMN